jgi:hypothetical protein
MLWAGVVAIVVAVLPRIARRAIPAPDQVLAVVKPEVASIADTLVNVPGILFGAGKLWTHTIPHAV